MNLALRKIVLMLGLALFVNACTKSSSSNSSKPEAPKTEAPAPTSPAPTADQEAGNRNKDKKETPEELDNSANIINFDEPISAEEIETLESQAKMYSSAASDNLREYLIQKFDEENDALKKAKNLKFAGSITLARMQVNSDKSGFKVILRVLDKDKNPKFLSFTGSTKPEVIATTDRAKKPVINPKKITLKAIDKKTGKEFKNQSGELQCLDTGRVSMFDCNTKLATINLNGATAKILMRSSRLNIHADFLGRSCATDDCQRVRDFFYNSEKEISTNQKLKSAVMETFEVIKGRSAFNILMVGFDLEVIKLEGNLPNEELYKPPTLDTLLNRKLSSDDLKDPVTGKARKTNMNKLLNDVRLQENDGQGGIRVKVRMALDRDTGEVDQFDINFSRIINQVRVP